MNNNKLIDDIKEKLNISEMLINWAKYFRLFNQESKDVKECLIRLVEYLDDNIDDFPKKRFTPKKLTSKELKEFREGGDNITKIIKIINKGKYNG